MPTQLGLALGTMRNKRVHRMSYRRCMKPKLTACPNSRGGLTGMVRARSRRIIATLSTIIFVSVGGCDCRGPSDAEQPEVTTSPDAMTLGAADHSDDSSEAQQDTESFNISGPIRWPVRLEDNRMRLELGTLTGPEWQRIRKEFSNAQTDASEAVRAYSPELMPEPLSGLRSVSVLTTDGLEEVKLSTVQRVRAFDEYFRLHGRAEEELADLGDGPVDNSYWSFAWPLGEAPNGVNRRRVNEGPVSVEVLQTLKPAVLQNIDEGRRAFIESAMSSSSFSCANGEFPEPHFGFCVVEVTADDGAPVLRAAYLLDNQVEITEVVVPPMTTVFGRVDITSLVDIDGDGHEGVLYVIHSHGWILRWLDFGPDGSPQVETIARLSTTGD